MKRKAKAGEVPRDREDWKIASDYWKNESPVARGNRFNQTVNDANKYPFFEVNLENGKRLDGYDPVKGEIVSRKATDLDKIKEETYRAYLSEFSEKYSRGTVIRSNKYTGKDGIPGIDGTVLSGQYILEIPASNESLENIQHYMDIAAEYDVILRFTEEIP